MKCPQKVRQYFSMSRFFVTCLLRFISIKMVGISLFLKKSGKRLIKLGSLLKDAPMFKRTWLSIPITTTQRHKRSSLLTMFLKN